MRAVVQRVSEASVTVDDAVVGCIGQGLLVLLGIEESDTMDDVEWLSSKLVRLRVFKDDAGAMNCSVLDVGGRIMVISQFTLLASTRKGNRPSYSRAARAESAVPLYERFLVQLASDFGGPIERGRFGADMKVSLVNAGPVTILMDSKMRE